MSDVTLAQSRRIKFDRTVRKDEKYGTQINTATCTMCGTEFWTQGHTEGVSGIGELNRSVGHHRIQHWLRGTVL